MVGCMNGSNCVFLCSPVTIGYTQFVSPCLDYRYASNGVTQLPKTLVNLIGTLLAENGLLSWQIFDEKSSNIVVKIWFGNGHCGPTTDWQSAKTVAAYRRKPPSQVRRDRARVAAHKRQQSAAPQIQTQSMAAACLQTEDQVGEQYSHTRDIEEARYRMLMRIKLNISWTL